MIYPYHDLFVFMTGQSNLAYVILEWTILYKGIRTGPAGPVLARPLFNSLAYMVKQNCMFEKSSQ